MTYTIRNKSKEELIEQLETQAKTVKRERKSRMELFRENSELKERIRKLEGLLIEKRLSEAKGEAWF